MWPGRNWKDPFPLSVLLQVAVWKKNLDIRTISGLMKDLNSNAVRALGRVVLRFGE